ncbi:MAG: hypothetical protein AAB223_06295, partial [Pseudomonadota bacterium]
WDVKQMIFSLLADGPEFDEAMEFFSGYLKPEEYDTERRLVAGRGWKLGKTLDLYLREFVKIGKGDIDDDGVEERFYVFDDPSWCGSSGCHIVILQKQDGAWRPICEMSGSDHHVWITDWMSEGSRRELKARWGVYWRNGACHDDDPKVHEEYGPDILPPRGERTWKPIR